MLPLIPLRRRAFTLIEILIVVVILGILAAISVPQFAKAAADSSLTATIVDLGRIRRAVEVYKARNTDALPLVVAGDGTWGPLVGRDSEYMLQPPTNQYVSGPNARKIVFANAPDTAFHRDYGWIYDTTTGQVWAACFTDADQVILP